MRFYCTKTHKKKKMTTYRVNTKYPPPPPEFPRVDMTRGTAKDPKPSTQYLPPIQNAGPWSSYQTDFVHPDFNWSTQERPAPDPRFIRDINVRRERGLDFKRMDVRGACPVGFKQGTVRPENKELDDEKKRLWCTPDPYQGGFVRPVFYTQDTFPQNASWLGYAKPLGAQVYSSSSSQKEKQVTTSHHTFSHPSVFPSQPQRGVAHVTSYPFYHPDSRTSVKEYDVQSLPPTLIHNTSINPHTGKMTEYYRSKSIQTHPDEFGMQDRVHMTTPSPKIANLCS